MKLQEKIVNGFVLTILLALLAMMGFEGFAQAEDWYTPASGTFTNKLNFTNNVSRALTLKFINLGVTSTNGAQNGFTVWHITTGDPNVVISNLLYTAVLPLNTTTNVRSVELNQQVRHQDTLIVINTNNPAAVTNEYYFEFSDRVK